MTPGQLRELIETAAIFKMSLGKSGKYEAEALAGNVLLFQSEARFYDAVVDGDEAGIRRAGARLVNDQNPDGNAGEQAVAIWRKTIGSFRSRCVPGRGAGPGAGDGGAGGLTTRSRGQSVSSA